MLNQTMSTFMISSIGMKIGTMITTIGTHSSGQPRMKQSARMARISRVGEMFHETSVSAM
jgi:hypothetical protein